jgi:hypothetical protein
VGSQGTQLTRHCPALRGHGHRLDSSGVSASSSPDLGEGVAEPFRSDPQFWRSVCASADAVRGYRFHRGHAPLPARVDTVRGELSWRDAERTAVAAVFVRALMRRRNVKLTASS